jgi:hypothetical protein
LSPAALGSIEVTFQVESVNLANEKGWLATAGAEN